VSSANNEAAATLDSTREMSAQLVAEARAEARQVGEAERVSMASEVEALKARRDFLESDVAQLELFLTEQRSRLRDAATSLIDISERVPGGIGAARPPLLSASDDDANDGAAGVNVDEADDAAAGEIGDDLVIVTEIAADEQAGGDDARGDDGEPTQAMPAVTAQADEADASRTGDDFRFSFDDDRR
jgi:hypothetical protein